MIVLELERSFWSFIFIMSSSFWKDAKSFTSTVGMVVDSSDEVESVSLN